MDRSRRGVGEHLTWRWFIGRKETASESVSLPASSSSLQNNCFLLTVPNSFLLLSALLQLETKVLRADRECGPEPGFLSACDDAMGTLPCSKTFPLSLTKAFRTANHSHRGVKSHHENLKVFKVCV